MDGWRRPDADSVIGWLKREPWRFSFEQGVGLLLRNGEAPRLYGETGMAFAPAELGDVGDGRLQARGLGPGGADGALPYGWLERLQQATQDKQPAAQDFLNLFQQRLLQHHYRSLGLYRLATPWAARELAPGFTLMRALCGLSSEALRRRTPFAEYRLLALSGLLADRRRPTRGFVALAAAALGVSLRVEEFVGRWQTLPASAQGKMGRRLGRDAIAGRRAWNQHAALRLHLTLDDEAQWRAFLPGGAGFSQLHGLGRIWFGAGVALELALSGSGPQDDRLTRRRPPLLGRTARLAGRISRHRRCLLHLTESESWT